MTTTVEITQAPTPTIQVTHEDVLVSVASLGTSKIDLGTAGPQGAMGEPGISPALAAELLSPPDMTLLFENGLV